MYNDEEGNCHTSKQGNVQLVGGYTYKDLGCKAHERVCVYIDTHAHTVHVMSR